MRTTVEVLNVLIRLREREMGCISCQRKSIKLIAFTAVIVIYCSAGSQLQCKFLCTETRYILVQTGFMIWRQGVKTLRVGNETNGVTCEQSRPIFAMKQSCTMSRSKAVYQTKDLLLDCHAAEEVQSFFLPGAIACISNAKVRNGIENPRR